MLLAVCCIITFSCCPVGPGPRDSAGEDDQQAVVPVGEEAEQPAEDVPMDEPTKEGESEAVDESDDAADSEESSPTQDQPLAEPAQPAEGSEDLPEGETGLAVSLSGAEGPVALTDGITVLASDALHVQCTVANRTDETMVFSFTTSQKLDVVFTDAEGNTVYQWSKDRRFAQVVNALELEAGDAWSHELTVPVGTEENQLPPGAYSLLVTLTGEPAMTIEASEVVIAP